MLIDADPEALATFVQEYVRREGDADAGPAAVIASQLRDPRWLPHQVAEHLLATPAIQAAVKVLRTVYKPKPVQEVSVDTISMDMETIYQDAKDARQFTAAIAAKKLQSELHGYVNRDINIRVSHKVEEMTTAQLMQIAGRAAGKDEAADGGVTIDGEFSEAKTGLASIK